MSTTLRSLLISLFVAVSYQIGQAANTSTLLIKLRIKLGQTDSTNSNWTNTELRYVLNDAQDMVATHSGGVDTVAYIAGGSARNARPSNFIALKGAAWVWRNGAEVTPVPFKPVDSFYTLIARNDEQNQGHDQHIVAEDGKQIVVFPPLNSADSLLISYYAYPARIGDSTGDTLTAVWECQLDAGWEQALLMAAAALAYEKIDDKHWTQYYTTERDKQIAALRALITRRPSVDAQR
jgi:hypothetical protein